MYVLDTNTISYYFRGDPQVAPRLQALPPKNIGVPAIVVYELQYGLLRLPRAAGKTRLAALAGFLQPLRVLAFDAGCADQAARLRIALERHGTPIGPHDVLIAATALRHEATLVTRNVCEFSRVPQLRVENWHETSQN